MSPMVGGRLPVPTVVMVIFHPPAKLPASPAPSSLTYKAQVPFGACPLKAAKFAEYGPDGAGAGQVSPVPMLVGLYVPDAMAPELGRDEPAASERVSVT